MNESLLERDGGAFESSNDGIERQVQVTSKSKAVFIVLAALVAALLGVFLLLWNYCIRMPGESFVPGTSNQKTQTNERSINSNGLVDVPESLESHVRKLAEEIGERNSVKYDNLNLAIKYIEDSFASYGLRPDRQTYEVAGKEFHNIQVEIPGEATPNEIVIVGAHYDSFLGTPGANDNGSGMASLLVLAEHFSALKPERTLRFVAFANEEPPWFQNRGEMGSWVYAEKCSREKQDVVAVLSLETMGYYSDEEDSQKYPEPLAAMYPSTGNFVGFVSNLASRGLQHQVIACFRQHAEIPSEGASLPQSIPGVGWSDHWSFWQEGYPGIMVTDTAPFRYPHYHKSTDTPDKLDYARLAKVVAGLTFVIKDLVRSK